MKEQRFHIIAIEREYASGGREIGGLAARKLGIPCYSGEILDMAAQRLRADRRSLEETEEKAVSSLMYSMYVMANFTKAGADSGNSLISRESELFFAESEIIRQLTQTPAIVVGRCAAHSLSHRQDVLRVFIHADAEFRKKRAIENYGVSEEKALEILRRADKRRSGYYRANTGENWKDSRNYHMVLDSGLLGVERCADILETCFRKGVGKE